MVTILVLAVAGLLSTAVAHAAPPQIVCALGETMHDCYDRLIAPTLEPAPVEGVEVVSDGAAVTVVAPADVDVVVQVHDGVVEGPGRFTSAGAGGDAPWAVWADGQLVASGVLSVSRDAKLTPETPEPGAGTAVTGRLTIAT